MRSSTTEGLKSKTKKSLENEESSATGVVEATALEDDPTRSIKRKRESQSGQRSKNKKTRRESEVDLLTKVDADVSGLDEGQKQAQDADLKNGTPSSRTARESKATKSRKTSASEDSPDPMSDVRNGTEQPKKGRGFRIGGKSQQKTGFFVEEEVKALEQFKIKFCNAHGVQGRVFDAMVQHSERGGDEWPLPTDVQSKNEFWNEIYALIPDRDRRSVYRFMRRHFQDTTQKAHVWTPEQDDELVRLHAQHGPKYALIAKLLGRSDDDVTQRWKNRLQHRATKRTGAWSEAELVTFVRSLEEYRKILIESSADPEKAGKDIWEMDLKSISWGSISNGMENSRTRQQCADKWRKISKNIRNLRETVDPDADFDPIEAARRWQRYNGSSSRERSRPLAVDDLVDSDDDDDEEEGSRIPSSTPAILPKLEFEDEQQSVDLGQVAQENDAHEPSIDQDDAEANGVSDAEDSPKPVDTFTEEFAAVEPASPSLLVEQGLTTEKQKLREEKREKKRRKKEEIERKKQEEEAPANARDETHLLQESEDNRSDANSSTPKTAKRKDKKRRKSELNDAELVESSRKKSKKEKKSKKAAQEDDINDGAL